jgi:hypothetical protein
MKKRLQLYLSLIIAASTLTSCNKTTSQVGYIDDFEGTLKNYTIKRGNKPIEKIGIYEPLYSNDLIYVSNNQFIDIRQCGETYRITHKDSPYQVKSKNCKVPGILGNLWLKIKDFMEYIVTITSNPAISTHTKSDEESLTIPILEGTFSAIPTLKAGQRALYLQWFGGKSPYKVQITTADKTILWQTESKTKSVKTAKIEFKAGQIYTLIINDTKYEFETIAKLPDYPAHLQDKVIPENMRQTLQAAWLKKQDNTKWSFEAYQQISDIADNYGPARELQKAILNQ